MANVSTLTVSLVAETAKFENGLKKAKGTSSGFGKAAGAAMKGAAIATGLLTTAIGALVKQSLALVDQQRKSARTLGTSQAIYAGLALAVQQGYFADLQPIIQIVVGAVVFGLNAAGFYKFAASLTS